MVSERNPAGNSPSQTVGQSEYFCKKIDVVTLKNHNLNVTLHAVSIIISKLKIQEMVKKQLKPESGRNTDAQSYIKLPLLSYQAGNTHFRGILDEYTHISIYGRSTKHISLVTTPLGGAYNVTWMKDVEHIHIRYMSLTGLTMINSSVIVIPCK